MRMTALARIALLLLVVAACSHEPKPALAPAEGALDELRAAVVQEVKDPSRARSAVALVDEMEKMVAAANADYRAHETKLWALTGNYDATEADFRALFRDFNARRDARQERTLDLHLRATKLLTADEWNALASLREKALRDAIEAGSEL
jgi:hypothetical protein